MGLLTSNVIRISFLTGTAQPVDQRIVYFSDEQDVVCAKCQLPELQVGDWLVFDRMGAYTLSIASRTGRPVMRYVLGGRESS